MHQIVFVLQHVHRFEDGTEDVKLLGVYSSRHSADAAIERARERPGFAAEPEGFAIDEYVLDCDEWRDGYVTVT